MSGYPLQFGTTGQNLSAPNYGAPTQIPSGTLQGVPSNQFSLQGLSSFNVSVPPQSSAPQVTLPQSTGQVSLPTQFGLPQPTGQVSLPTQFNVSQPSAQFGLPTQFGLPQPSAQFGLPTQFNVPQPSAQIFVPPQVSLPSQFGVPQTNIGQFGAQISLPQSTGFGSGPLNITVPAQPQFGAPPQPQQFGISVAPFGLGPASLSNVTPGIEQTIPPEESTQLPERQPLEESQRPTAFVNRIYAIESGDVPPEVVEYRRLSKEERALRMTDPRLLGAMAVRCTGCKKVIKQIPIETGLRSGKSLREVLDEGNYIRICCRKQIQNEPVVVNIQKEIGAEQSTINMMRNLSIASTAASITNRGPISGTFGLNVPQSGIRIVNEAPPGLIQEGIQISTLGSDPSEQGRGGICYAGLTESFMETRPQTGDAFEMFMGQLETNEDVDD